MAVPAVPASPAVSGPVTMNVITGFSPPVVVVANGGTVTWVNTDTSAHTATSYLGGPPNSPTINPGSSYTVRFSGPGVVAYHCQFHPWMNGLVVVTA